MMKRDYHPKGYETCVHSRKRAHADWRVWPSCPNPLKLPGNDLPYKRVCNECPFYCREEKP